MKCMDVSCHILITERDSWRISFWKKLRQSPANLILSGDTNIIRSVTDSPNLKQSRLFRFSWKNFLFAK